MGDEAVSRDVFDGQNRLCSERFARDKERLDAHACDMRKVQELTVQMGEMIKRHDRQIDNHEKRISSIERQPADQYGKVKMTIISALISVLVSGLASAAFTTMK